MQKHERAAIAIYHATTKPLSRNAGRSSVAAAAYRSGVKIEDLRTAQIFDFTRRGGVVLAEICAPPTAGDFARDRARLWNAAEFAEKRKDARTAREWIIALPAELSPDERADLARDFAYELVDRYGVAVDLALHAPSRRGDDRNFHAHLLCTTRVVRGGGLEEKADIELSDTKRKTLGLGSAAEEITVLRRQWEELANAALARAGKTARIDHRSLEDQQSSALENGDLLAAARLARTPQTHSGPAATAMDRREMRPASERGQHRARCIAEAHRTSAVAPAVIEGAVRRQLAPAKVLVLAEKLGWASEGPELAPLSEARAADGPLWAPASPPKRDLPESRAEIGPEGALERPARNQEVIVDSSEGGGPGLANVPGAPNATDAVPRTIIDLRQEIARRSRDTESRLDEAVPERVLRRDLANEARVRNRVLENALELRASAKAELKRWERQHPLRAILARLGWADHERDSLVKRVRDWEADADEALSAREKAVREGRAIRCADAEALARSRIEAAVQADQARLPVLREALAALEGAESTPQLQASVPENPPVTAHVDSLDAERVAAFAAGRVGVGAPGPRVVLQAAYDQVAGIDRSPFAPKGVKPPDLSPEQWNEVAIHGGARALAAGNNHQDVREALAEHWPGHEISDELLLHAEAQRVLDRIKCALDEGREPGTEGGRLLVAVVTSVPNDTAARNLIVETLAAARLAVATDPAFSQQDSDRPAPRLS